MPTSSRWRRSRGSSTFHTATNLVLSCQFMTATTKLIQLHCCSVGGNSWPKCRKQAHVFMHRHSPSAPSAASSYTTPLHIHAIYIVVYKYKCVSLYIRWYASDENTRQLFHVATAPLTAATCGHSQQHRYRWVIPSNISINYRHQHLLAITKR